MTVKEIRERIELMKDSITNAERRIKSLEQYRVDMPHKCYGHFLDDTIVINMKLIDMLRSVMIPKLERKLHLAMD